MTTPKPPDQFIPEDFIKCGVRIFGTSDCKQISEEANKILAERLKPYYGASKNTDVLFKNPHDTLPRL